MLVRSPMFTKSESSVMFSGSRPERRIAGCGFAGSRGVAPSMTSAMREMWAGVVPQQPPTRLIRPAPVNSLSTVDIWSGVSSYSPNSLGRPALG